MKTIRYLDRIEVQLLNMPRTFYLEYHGGVIEDAIHQAIQCTENDFPILRARVAHENGSFALFAAGESHVSVLDIDGGLEVFQNVAREWDFHEGVARVVLARNPGRGYLGLTTDHSIADGLASRALLEKIWVNYTKIVQNDPIPEGEPAFFPCSPTEVLKQRGLIGGRTLSAGGSERFESATEKIVLCQRSYKMSRLQTSNLKRVANQNQTTIHALVCGAALTAQRQNLSNVEAPMRMSCLSTVDVRRYVAPPVHPYETTNFAGLQHATVDVPLNGNLLEVGISVKRQLARGIANNEPVAELVQRIAPSQSDFEKTIESVASARGDGMMGAMVSNLGALPDITSPAGVDVTDCRLLSYAGHVFLGNPAYVVSSYGGQLRVDFLYPPDLFQPQDSDSIWDGVQGRLETLASDCD